MTDQTAKHVISDLKLIIEGYKSTSEVFERELNAQTHKLQVEEEVSRRLYDKLRQVQEELEIEKRYSAELKARLHAAA